MPVPIPDRYRLEVRLGRVADIEEWLGTDVSLDRPVLIRLLGPDTTPDRRSAFVEAIRAAATVSHPHLASVYEAATTDEGAFAVEEWVGGITIAHRLAAGDALPLEEILPNGSGLSDALAALHDIGIVHGCVAPDAIWFSAAHPAKLHGFGRPPVHASPAGDTAALATTLAAAITGTPHPLDGSRPSPSELRAGVPPAVDEALQKAASGEIDAASLGAVFHAAPTAFDEPEPAWSWRWAAVAVALLIAAALTAALGLALRVRPSDSPLLFPAVPVETTVPTVTAPTTTTPSPQPRPPAAIIAIPAPYDPFGDRSERDEDVALVADSDPDTSWRTERYFDALHRIKPGVGLTFLTSGSPRLIDFTVTDGTRYVVAWAAAVPEDFAGWERAASGEVSGERARVQLPPRAGGVWLLWLTDLPARDGGEYFYTELAEVRFQP